MLSKGWERKSRENAGTPINLMAREGGVRDVAACCALFGLFRFVFDDVTWESLPKMWETLLSVGAMRLCHVENRALAGESGIVAFCATLFTTEAFCREARSILPPYLGLELAWRYRAGKLPVLDHDKVARANAGSGVNLMLCYTGWRRKGLAREEVLAVREKLAEAFYLTHYGYRLNEFLAEPVGEESFRWMLGIGLRLRRDYAEHFQKRHLPVPETWRRSWLLGLTKEEALADYGSHASGFFVHTAPRFHFRPSEQTLLQHALDGETDEEMAAKLFVSPWTVKKRWHAVYEHVADVDLELLGRVGNGLESGSRGAERRRRLLNYLRQHLEELRPLKR